MEFCQSLAMQDHSGCQDLVRFLKVQCKCVLKAANNCGSSKSAASNMIRTVIFLDLDNSYLPGVGLNHDHGGGYPRARLLHCTPESVDPCDFPKCGKLGRVISVSGDLRSR